MFQILKRKNNKLPSFHFPIFPLLEKLLKDENVFVREAAQEAIEKIKRKEDEKIR